MVIRRIEPGDNTAIADVVRAVMTEFGADPKTTVLGDHTLNTMYENYQEKGAGYYVVEVDGQIIGGAGIRRLDGAGETICELQRMFLLPEGRGKGIGRQLMTVCLEDAKKFGYKTIYLESLSNMRDAIGLYHKTGFQPIEKAMGNTGHGGCNVYMTLNLE
jgi:putative acetyltransferase